MQIHILDVLAVRMHHWADSKLTVGGVYELMTEKQQREDTNVVAIHENGEIRAYLTCEWAAKVHTASPAFC